MRISDWSSDVCSSDLQAPAPALDAAAGLFQMLGKTVSIVDDLPGLVVMRTVAMLANEAAEAVHVGVASRNDIDSAMKFGVNYPVGPLAWAEKVGFRHILENLDALHADRKSVVQGKRVYVRVDRGGRRNFKKKILN